MIEISNLVKKFGAATALDGITCSIGGGSVFGLVGSNGAGKSTLLRILSGVYRPDGGTVLEIAPVAKYLKEDPSAQ